MSDGLWQVVALLFTIGLGLITVGFIAVVLETKQWKPVLWGVTSIATGAILVFVVIVILMGGTISRALARDLDGRYAASPLKPWFDTLKSAKGLCCSDADGTALSDVDWKSKDGRYQVQLEGQWWDVPEDAVITEPNRAGRTMVWPVVYRGLGAAVRIEIRCFMPGSMT